MNDVIDVSSDCGDKATALAANGVKTVIRYYSRDTIRPSKPLRKLEAQRLADAGLRIGIVYEGRFGDHASNFDRQAGLADGAFARSYGAGTIGQPSGSTIYFGIDFDASVAEMQSRILPYFQGIADAFAKPTGEPNYIVGVYGSGATCQAVLDAGLAQRAWLAQSRGWRNYDAFVKSGQWTLKQAMPGAIAGVSCDSDEVGAGKDVGDFQLSAPAAAAPAHAMRVIARSGLRLRSGPGTEFDAVRLLPFGTIVHPIKTVGAWTMVDLEGDGVADGFVSGAYLSDAGGAPAAPAAPAATGPATEDAAHVPELIRRGSSADGLKEARTAAAASLPGYPKNGCAAHLSALLRESGIDIPLTWGAGKLAHLLADRGWTKIAVGKQMAGDVGVTFDNDPTPVGADHIYLVVKTLGPDEMLIADNQRTKDEPHSRFASGQGKTPTEYFLRAE